MGSFSSSHARPDATTSSHRDDACDRVRILINELVGAGELSAAAACFGRCNEEPMTVSACSLPQHASMSTGNMMTASATDAASPVSATNTRFLIASLTKPMVSTAALMLAARGQLTLADRVVEWIPEFTGGTRRSITLRHLITHTSGLPEVWDDNNELRAAHASREAFVESGCRVALQSRPGQTASYSSVGYSLLGAILERASGVSLPDLLTSLLFEPLGMTSTELGARYTEAGNPLRGGIVDLRLPDDVTSNSDWHWNSPYWRQLGAPWGGVISTASDVWKFLAACLGWNNAADIPARLRDAAFANQLPEMGVTAASGLRRGWGLGWRLNWPAHSAALCELLPAEAVGHYGATGSVMWTDGHMAAVILTDVPIGKRPRHLQRISNVIATQPGPPLRNGSGLLEQSVSRV